MHILHEEIFFSSFKSIYFANMGHFILSLLKKMFLKILQDSRLAPCNIS